MASVNYFDDTKMKQCLLNVFVKFLLIPLILLSTTNGAFAVNWHLVLSDNSGYHYLDIDSLKYEPSKEIATFKVLTNEKKWKSTHRSLSTLTSYIMYCHPNPRLYNRIKINSYSKEWGKGKVMDTLSPHLGDWQVEEDKELKISILVCKEKRIL